MPGLAFCLYYQRAPDQEGSLETPELKPFFEPEGVAIVGARRSPGFGYGVPIVLDSLGWGDRLRLVNPAGGELHGLPLYRRIADTPGPVDLAVIMVAAEKVPEVLEEVANRGIRHAVIESAGFAEVGGHGAALQKKAAYIARERGVRVIGPNCVGVVNTSNRFTTVEVIDEALTPGKTSIIAQSGVFGNVLLDLLHHYRLYIAKAVTLGNRMDIDECDVLSYLEDDPDTRVIMMYLEGAADGRRLRERLTTVTGKKPVLVLKSGRTEAGRSATASHTGSISGEDELYDALFSQAGAVRVTNLEELVETARVFSSQPPPRGNRLGIVTSSGSLGVMATDAAVAGGLVVPPLSASTVKRVRHGAPEWMNVKNPLDVGPSPKYAEALEAMIEDPGIDMVLAITILPFAVYRQFERAGMTGDAWFGDLASVRDLAPDKPVVVCAIGHRRFVDHMAEVAGLGVALFVSREPAVRALAALNKHWKGGSPR